MAVFVKGHSVSPDTGRPTVGRSRQERDFRVGHTGGDLSLPDDVKAKVMPRAFPVVESDLGLIESIGRKDAPGPPSAAGDTRGDPS